MRYLAFFVVNPNISHHEERLEDNILCYYPHDTPINTQLYDVGFTTALLKLHERFQELPTDSKPSAPAGGRRGGRKDGDSEGKKEVAIEEVPHENGLPKPLCVTLATKRYVLLSIDVDCYLGVVVQREIYIPRSRRGFLSFPNWGPGTLNDVEYAMENEDEEDTFRREAASGHTKGGGKSRQDTNSKSKHLPHRRRRLSGCWNETASNPLYDDEDDFSVDVIAIIVKDVYGAFCFHLGGIMHLYNRFQNYVKSAHREAEVQREEKQRKRERFARQRKIELSISSRDGASNTLLPQVYKPSNFGSTASLGSARTTITRQQCCECGYETMYISCNNRSSTSERSPQTSLVSSTTASVTNDARVLMHDGGSKRTPLSASHSSLPSSVVEEGSYRGPSSMCSLSDGDSGRNGTDAGTPALFSHDRPGAESTSIENRGFLRHLRESVTLKEVPADEEDDRSTDDCILTEQEFLHGAELRLQCRRSPNSSSTTEPAISSSAIPGSLDGQRDLKPHGNGGQGGSRYRKNSLSTVGEWEDSARTDTTHSREGNAKEPVLGAKELARRLEKRGRAYLRELLRSHLVFPLRLALDRSCSYDGSARDLEGTFLATDGLNVATVNSFGGDASVSALIHTALQTFVGRLTTAFPGALMECVVVLKERKQVALSTLSVQRTKQFMRLVSGEAPWSQIIVPASSYLPIWDPVVTKSYEEPNENVDDGNENENEDAAAVNALGDRSTHTQEQAGVVRGASLSEKNLMEKKTDTQEHSPAPSPTYRGNFCGTTSGAQGRSPVGTPETSLGMLSEEDKPPEDKLMNLGSSKESTQRCSRSSQPGTLPIPVSPAMKNARGDGNVHSGGDAADGATGGNSVASRDEAFVSPLTLDRGNNSLARQGRGKLRLPSGRTASWMDSSVVERRRRSPCSPSDRDSESYGASPSSPSSRLTRTNEQGERCVRCGGRLVAMQHQFVSAGGRSVTGISALRASLASPISKYRSSKVIKSPKKAERQSIRRSNTVGDALRNAVLKVNGLLLNVNEQSRGIAFPQELGGGFTAWLVVNDLYAAVAPLWDGFLQELMEAVTQWKTQVDLLDHPPPLIRGGALVGGGAAANAAANGRRSATASTLAPGESRLLTGLSTVNPGFLQSLFPGFSKSGAGGGVSGESQSSQEKHGGFGLLQSMVPGTGFISKLLSNTNELRSGAGQGSKGPFHLIAASQESWESVPVSSALLPTETEVQAVLLDPLTSAQLAALRMQCMRSLATPPHTNQFRQPSVFSAKKYNSASAELSPSSKKRKFLFWTFGDGKATEHTTAGGTGHASPTKNSIAEEEEGQQPTLSETSVPQAPRNQPTSDSYSRNAPTITTSVPSGTFFSSLSPLSSAVQFDGLESVPSFAAADAWIAPAHDGKFSPQSPTTRTTAQPKLSASTVEQQKGTVIFHYRNEFIGQEKTSFGPRLQPAALAEITTTPAPAAGTGHKRDTLKLSSSDNSEDESRTSDSQKRSPLSSGKSSSISLSSENENDTDSTTTFTGSDSASVRGDRNGQTTIRQADREAMHQLDILRHSVFSTFFSVSLRPSCHDEDGADDSGAFATDPRGKSTPLWSLPNSKNNSGYEGANDMEGGDSLLRGELEVWLQLHSDTWLSLKKVGLRTFSCVVSDCKSFRDAEESVMKSSRVVFSNAMQILGDASDDDLE